MKKQYLTVQVMKLKITPDGLELGWKGGAVIAAALLLSLGLGVYVGHSLFNLVDLMVPAAAMAAGLVLWSLFLLSHVKKNMPSITRLLVWVSVLGLTLGFLVSTAL